MTVTQRQPVIIHGGKMILVGLIFVVEGTHENLNPTKISAYTVSMVQQGCHMLIGDNSPVANPFPSLYYMYLWFTWVQTVKVRILTVIFNLDYLKSTVHVVA